MQTDRNMASDAMNQQVVTDGMTVYDSTGAKIGAVDEYNSQGNYIAVRKGLIFQRDIYIPTSAITQSNQDGVYLNMTKDDLSGDTYKSPPRMERNAGQRMAGSENDGITARTQTAAPGLAGLTPTAPITGSARNGRADQMTNQQDIAVPVVEEELTVGKQRAQTGNVHLHRDVTEQQQSINVPVTHEEVVVERTPVNGDATSLGADAFTDKDIDVPVMGEQATVGKVARVTEEVRLRKEAITEQQRVGGTVRKEQVTVEGNPDGVVDEGQSNVRNQRSGADNTPQAPRR